MMVFWHTSGGTRGPAAWKPVEPEFKGFAPLPGAVANPPTVPDLDSPHVANAPAANPLPVLPGGEQAKNEALDLSDTPVTPALGAGNEPGIAVPTAAAPGAIDTPPLAAGSGLPAPVLPGLGSSPEPPAVVPGLGTTLGTTAPAAAPPSMDGDKANFNGGFADWAFQLNLDLEPPKIDAKKLRRYKPHNYKGEGHPTYATYVATPGGNLTEPYFVAAQQLIFRTLWDPRSGGKHPFTAFVAPHITEEQRSLLEAAGAIVRELEPVAWHPVQGTFGRWKYQFAKLNMWAQTDFSKIFFLDSDAFPVQKIDDVFDTPEAECDKESLSVADQPAEGICQYTFMAAQQNPLPNPATGVMELNTGVMLLQPNAAMHQRLMREMPKTEKWDTSMADQGFLSEMFKSNGTFPYAPMPRAYNGFFPGPQDEGKLKVVHEKLWIDPEQALWTKGFFSSTHKAMRDFYESPEFLKVREKDGLRAY